MKTISGKVVSSKPVSLSKAARILSKFASSDNGASPAFAAYLKRASASFHELVQLHKELKGSNPERKRKERPSDNAAVEDAADSVRKHTDKGMTTEEKQKIGEREKHKGGERAERKDRELEDSLKTDNEHKWHNRKRAKGELSTGGKSEGSLDVNGVKNDVEGECGSKELRRHKKKKNRKTDEGQKKKVDAFAETEMEEQNRFSNQDAGYSEAAEMVPDDGSKPNKSAKKTKEKGSRNIEVANIGAVEGRKHRKQIHAVSKTQWWQSRNSGSKQKRL